jgi:chromosome segregation ATPase
MHHALYKQKHECNARSLITVFAVEGATSSCTCYSYYTHCIQEGKSTMGSRRGSSESLRSAGSSGASVMLEVRSQRKQAEADVQSLATRIAYLQAEDAKAKKLIADAEAQTTAAVARRKSKEQAAAKLQADHSHTVARRNSQCKVLEQRKSIVAKIESTRNSIDETRKAQAEALREERRKLQALQQETRAKTAEDNRSRGDVIRAEREKVRAKREAEEQAKQAALEQAYTRRLEEEQKKVLNICIPH